MQLPKDATAPKTMVIDGVTIYIQLLTSSEAKACGVTGWDAVLADSKRFKLIVKLLTSGPTGVTAA